MKRFWTTASVAPHDDGFSVQLDGRPMRLPGGAPLRVATAPLAEALAAEWKAAGGALGGTLDWDDLPLTRLAGTAQDRIAPDPAATVSALAAYGTADLLCYRGEDPRLAERQSAAWQPVLDWAALALDAPLRATTGIMPIAQPPAAIAALRAAVAKLGPLELAALGVLVPAFGSLVLGLAVALGRLDASAAHALALLDETFQEAAWGQDAEALARRRHIAAEVAMAGRLLALARA